MSESKGATASLQQLVFILKAREQAFSLLLRSLIEQSSRRTPDSDSLLRIGRTNYDLQQVRLPLDAMAMVEQKRPDHVQRATRRWLREYARLRFEHTLPAVPSNFSALVRYSPMQKQVISSSLVGQTLDEYERPLRAVDSLAYARPKQRPLTDTHVLRIVSYHVSGLQSPTRVDNDVAIVSNAVLTLDGDILLLQSSRANRVRQAIEGFQISSMQVLADVAATTSTGGVAASAQEGEKAKWTQGDNEQFDRNVRSIIGAQHLSLPADVTKTIWRDLACHGMIQIATKSATSASASASASPSAAACHLSADKFDQSFSILAAERVVPRPPDDQSRHQQTLVLGTGKEVQMRNLPHSSRIVWLDGNGHLQSGRRRRPCAIVTIHQLTAKKPPLVIVHVHLSHRLDLRINECDRLGVLLFELVNASETQDSALLMMGCFNDTLQTPYAPEEASPTLVESKQQSAQPERLEAERKMSLQLVGGKSPLNDVLTAFQLQPVWSFIHWWPRVTSFGGVAVDHAFVRNLGSSGLKLRNAGVLWSAASSHVPLFVDLDVVR